MSTMISVLTPSFNAAQTLQRAIDSVINQSYTDWEHIIVDGGSTDGTVEILKTHSHLKWKSEKDKGQSDAMNKAFRMCSGDIIVYLNADDYFYRDAFNTIVMYFESSPKAEILVGNLDCIYEGDLTTHTDATISWKDLSILKGRFPLNPVSYFYKRCVQERIGSFPLNEHYTMDYWFLIRAFYLFEVKKIDALLGVFVFTENNKSSKVKSEYDIQMPHALKFCWQYTPWRLIYVTYKLIVHPKRKRSILSIAKKRVLKLKHGLR